MQEIDAARRAAILRGETPPPFPEEDGEKEKKRDGRRIEGHDRKRRRLAGEDDTDRDIRLARVTTEPRDENNAAIVKLRRPDLDAPLTDHAGNINLFPIDQKEAIQQQRREKNAEAEKERKQKEKALEDQYTMRFSNAAGRGGLERPWYTAVGSNTQQDDGVAGAIAYPGFAEKDVWGNEDPRRKEREQARMTTSDPFAFMQRAQTQLKKSREDKKKWADERDRELMELRAAQEREHRRERHLKRKRRPEDGEPEGVERDHRRHHDERSTRHDRRHRSRSRSRERGHDGKSSHRHERRHHRSRSRERKRASHPRRDQ